MIYSKSSDYLKQLTRSFHLNLTAFGFLGFIVGLFIVYSTLNLSFEETEIVTQEDVFGFTSTGDFKNIGGNL